MGKRVVVAMSGGVDSSVAAALLKDQGYEVSGMMLKLWSEPGFEGSNRCCTPDAMALARQVADQLDIPFYVIDAKEIFLNTVVQSFLDGYLQGITPNPCLICNRVIRWDYLLGHALAAGADFLATGHYVRLDNADQNNVRLFKAADDQKDQSYVLYQMTQEKLTHALFPLGSLIKSDVRKMAEKFGFPTAQRADSQDLCFLAGEDYREFIRRHLPSVVKPGLMVDKVGKILGEHQGLAFYTIGQRKGLRLATEHPKYVLDKDPISNTLIVGEVDELGQTQLKTGELNWLSGNVPSKSFSGKVKTRYTTREANATVKTLDDGTATIYFEEPQRDITPGQAAVIYSGEELLGGGIIRITQ